MRTLDIIEYIVARPSGVVAQDIAAALAIPVSSLSYLLATLVERDYLKREGRRYLPGPGLDRLRAPFKEMTLEERVTPLVRSLRLHLNETVSFFVRVGWEMKALVTETAEQSLRYSIRVGTRTPMHCLAGGKAMLAALSPEEFERYLAEATLSSFTARTIFDEAVLRAEINEIRACGIARTYEEYTPGIRGIGKVLMVDDMPLGAFAVAIPIPRCDAQLEERTIEQLTETVRLFANL
ncbi:MAG: IclR family transcriptional regulator [Sphingobium sp.]|nr:IclR family transcriptional regulator [Sphingobium sp.]